MLKMSLILSGFLSLSLFAAGAKYDKTQAFIKLVKGSEFPTSELISSTKHLFGENYLVQTSDVDQLIKELESDSSIKRIEKNYYAEKEVLPKMNNKKSEEIFFNSSVFNDPKADRVWSFIDGNDHGISINKSYLAPLSLQKEEIIVAVVDTGVDYNHEDLRDVMWKNENEIAGNNIDDDNNGYVDDIFGIDPLSGDTDPMASHAHGTHVSGTIAAKQNNNIGIAGIATNAKIMAIRTVPDTSDETDADVVESFLYAGKNGARILNCSFGKKHNEGGMIVNETIDFIGEEYGALVVAAAGNDYKKNIDVNLVYPASFQSNHLMVVASTTKRGKLSSFSNVGVKNVDVAAPGSSIYSTVPGNSYSSMSGTSMASPTTAGVAAEVLSHFPDLTGESVKTILMNSVTKVRKFDKYMASGGRVDLYNALRYTLENYAELIANQK
jgi:subtilisin family serine protease